MVLSQEEIDGCREAFLAFDKDRSGTIDVWELRQVLEAMGQKPTEEELFQMIITIIENHPQKKEMKERLKIELTDAIGMCFTGRMNRMVNALVGFVDGIQIGLSVKEELQMRISAIVKKLMDKKIKKKKAKEEMEEMFKEVGENEGVSGNYKTANIMALDDFDDDDDTTTNTTYDLLGLNDPFYNESFEKNGAEGVIFRINSVVEE